MLRDCELDPSRFELRRGGLVEYWHAYGWSDLRRSTTNGDFECD